MKKPQPVRSLRIKEAMPETRCIVFWLAPGKEWLVRDFGHLKNLSGNKFDLVVSPIYDFDEVYQYIVSIERGETPED